MNNAGRYSIFFLVILFLVLHHVQGTEVETDQETDIEITDTEITDAEIIDGGTAGIKITGKELRAYITPEFNRAFLFCWDIAAVGALTLNDRYTVKSGLALGTAGTAFDIKMLVSGEAAPFANVPVSFGLNYQYNGLPKFENHTHSLVLLASYKTQRAGISLGHNFHFTSFFGGAAVFEPIFVCTVYVYFINNETLKLGLRASNYDDFTSGNIAAYFLSVDSVVRLNEKISLINEIEIRQSGSIALASNFYGIVYRGGAVFSW